MMLAFVVGLFIFSIITYLLFMLLLPEWVGISKKDANDQESIVEPNSDSSLNPNANPNESLDVRASKVDDLRANDSAKINNPNKD